MNVVSARRYSSYRLVEHPYILLYDHSQEVAVEVKVMYEGWLYI